MHETLDELMAVLQDRKANPVEGSYTCKLLSAGDTRILKKIGEEASEVIIAGALEDEERLLSETADLLYHLSVMLVSRDLTWADVEAELARRRH